MSGFRVVVDPGHGGDQIAGSSTPFGCWRDGPLPEKQITLDIARRVRACAPDRVVLTREHDHNLSLAGRLAVARRAGAAAFLSIHAGGASDERDTWIHPRANASSRRFGSLIARALAAGANAPLSPPRIAPLAILDPAFHDDDVAASMIELGRADHPGNSALFDPRYRQAVADTLANAMLSGSEPDSSAGTTGNAPGFRVLSVQETYFDVWHEVPLVQQLTGMSCWAAAAAMLVGWRDCIDIDADEVARGSGRWESYRDGLEPRDVEAFAHTWGLEVARPLTLSVVELRRLLELFGPLWVGEASPGLHVVVVAGVYGDGSSERTFVRVADPWPIGRGERYTLSFRDFAANLRRATLIAGGLPQILHARAGSRRALAGAAPREA